MKKMLFLAVSMCSLINLAQSQSSSTPFIKIYKPQLTQCISNEVQKIISERVMQNVQKLRAEGKLVFNEKIAAPFKLGWPLKAANNFTDSFFYVETNFVDRDATTNLLDWNCGARTYDGHNGTDISLWPFPWTMMDKKMVKVVAAAAGVIVDKHDGDFDRNCFGSADVGNYVVLQHSNGNQTIYYHCKKGTVTLKAIGASVASGETLGYAGSSGNSAGVHLHFGVYDSLFNVVDPYKGACNNIAATLWKTQPPYWGRSLHKIMVTTIPTVYPECPNPEQINELPTVPLGLNGYFFAFLSEVKGGDTVYLKIIKPNNSVWQNYNFIYPNDYIFAYAYWIWYFDLSQPAGTWKWQVTYNNKTFTYNFTVTQPLAAADQSIPYYTMEIMHLQLRRKMFRHP